MKTRVLTITFLSFFSFFSVANAQRYWIASSSSNWNNTANWSASSNGPGGASVPGSADLAVFNGAGGKNGNCTLDVVPTVAGITMSGYTGAIDLSGNNITSTNVNIFASGTINNSGAAASLILNTAAQTTFSGTIFNVAISGSSGRILFNGSTFNNAVTLSKTAAGNDNGLGGSTFGATTIIDNATTSALQLGGTNPDTFNGSLSLSVSSTGSIAIARVAAGNVFNGNVTLVYGAAGQISFGANGGTSSLTAGKTISIGAVGAGGAGDLSLLRFTQLGATAQTISLTGNSVATLTIGPSTTFNGNLTATSPSIILNSSTFNGTTQLTKTGTNADSERGGNIFNGSFTLNNQGADFLFGSNSSDAGDTWNSDATFNNSGGNRIRVAEQTAGNVFMGNATFNCLGSATDVNDRIQVSRLAGGQTTFNGTTTFNNTGATSDFYISYDAGTSTTFNGPVFYNELATGSTEDYIGGDGTVIINSDITFTNTTTNTIWMSQGVGAVTFGNGLIKVGATGFSNGELRLRNFTQTGATTQSLTLTGTATLRVGPSSSFNGAITFVSPQLYLNGATYNSTAVLEKNGATDNAGTGGNIFNGTATITNSGSGYLMTGNGSADTFVGTATFNNTGSYRFYFAHNHSGQTTTFASDVILNSNKTGGGDQWSFLMAENAGSAVSFARTLTINSSGSVRSDIRFLNGTGSAATYNGQLTVNQSNSNASTTITLGGAGTSTYNDNIVVSNTNGTSGILFNATSTAGSTLAATKSITLGGAFTAGNLSLARFVQNGGGAQTLNTFSGTSILTLGPSSVFGGDVNFKAPQIVMNGCTFSGVALLEKTGATDNTGNGGDIFNGPATLINSGSGAFEFGNTLPVTFNSSLVATNTGTNRMQFGLSSANNVFNGPTTFNFAGSNAPGTNFIVARNAGSSATFNGDLTLNSANTAAGSGVIIGNDGNVTINANVTVMSSNGRGILLAGGLGSVTLSNGFTIKDGGSGTFTTGALTLSRFTQVGATPQALTLEGTALLTLTTSTQFNGNVNFKAPQVTIANTTFNGTATIEKTGATNNASSGGNVFNAQATLNNSGSGSFTMGNGASDQFNGVTTFNNTGSHSIYLAYNHPGQTTTFASDLTLNSNKTGSGIQWSYLVCENPGAISIAGNLNITCGGSIRSDHRFLNGSPTTMTVGGVTTINVSNTNSSTAINMGNAGTTSYNGDVSVSNSGGASGIFFNTGASASSTLANGKTITIGGGGFSSGTLSLHRFIQSGTTPQSLTTFSGTATLLVGPASSFGGNVDFKAPQVYLNGCTYGGTATIEKTGATDNAGTGGNVFTGAATLTNSGSGYFLIGGTNADQFNGTATFNNTGSYRMYFAHGHTNQTTTFASDVFLNSNKTSGGDTWSFFYGEGANVGVSFGGNLTINCAGTLRSDHRVLNGAGSTATYSGTTAINVSNTSANTAINMGVTGTSSYGNITVSNSGGASGIFFNTSATASSTMASGKTISIGAGGFNAGTLSLIRFTQVGATTQTLNTFSGTAILLTGPSSSFDGDVNFKAPQLYLNGTTFNRTALLEKTGASNNDNLGGNVFNSTTTITNSSTARLRLAFTTGDNYNGSITFAKTSSGALEPAYSSTNLFAGDVSTNSSTALTFGANTGIVEFSGSASQTVSKTVGTSSPIYQRMRMNKTAGTVTLGTDVTIGTAATFTAGVMNTTTANYLNIADNATVSGASNSSYADGPVRKTGDDAFTFPVGSGGFYRSIAISAPSNTAHHFTAQYFKAAQNFGGPATWDPSFFTVSACDYWILDRTGATPAPASNVIVTLSWNENACGGPGYITSLAGLRVARWSGTNWVNHGNGGATGTTSAGLIPTSAVVTSFSPFALASVTPANPLPIELAEFTAQDNGSVVSVLWQTQSETNSDKFVLQRSQDEAKNFTDIAMFNAAGTTSETHTYHYLDKQSFQGTIYYRLKEIDHNGEISYPGITAVTRLLEDNGFTAHPNPVRNGKIYLNGTFDIFVINSLQQIVNEIKNTSVIDVTLLPSGMYTIFNERGQFVRFVKE